MASELNSKSNRDRETGADQGVPETVQPSWQRDLIKGFLWALLIVVSILFYTGTASHFIYVDF